MNNKKYEHILLLGRPASGKSELIDYLKNMPADERLEKFHIGSFEQIDDFPWLWDKFLEDNVWEGAGYPRKYSLVEGQNMGLSAEGGPLFDFCLEKFNIDIKDKYLSNPEFYKDNTLFIEFSRGGNEGYKNAMPRLSKEILEKAVIFYVKVTGEESKRRNIKRYEEKLAHSILAHKVADETFEIYYRKDDWNEFTGGDEFGFVTINDVKIPFVTMNNEPELPPSPEIAERYKKAFDKLYELYSL